MSKQIALAAQPRAGTGKGEARALRRQGRVPAVAYGAGLGSTSLWVDARELYHVLHTDAGLNAVIALDVDGETHLALAREIHRHPVRREILHVDFVTIDRDIKVTVEVPIQLRGEAPGVEQGGVLNQELYSVSVEVLPLEVPDHLVLDVSGLNLGDVKRVSDLTLPEGVTALTDPEHNVVSVVAPTVEEEPEEAEVEEAEGVTEEEAEAIAAEGGGTPAEAAAGSE